MVTPTARAVVSVPDVLGQWKERDVAKNIIFCADGTWNNPNEDDNSDQSADPTNVYKLFLCLDGTLSPNSVCDADEQEKDLTKDGATLQVSKYIHGVGDSRNPIIKLLGGAYLIFLGLTMIFERSEQLSLPSNFRRRTTAAAFRQGVLTNVLNPKVALFFLAFLPQFIDPASGTKVFAFLFLGLTFVTTGTIWCLILAWFASAFSNRLRTNETVAQWLNRTAGALFVFLGMRLATAKQ